MATTMPGRNGGTLIRPDKGETMNPNGRPRRTLRVILDEWEKQGIGRVSKEDVKHAYELVVHLSEDKMKEIMNDKEAPMLIRIVAKALLTRRGFDILESVLDRAHGKAEQKMNVSETTNVNEMLDKLEGKNIDKETIEDLKKQYGL